MSGYYELKIGDLTRQLPLCPINENLYIAAFVMLGDVELSYESAKELLKIAPEHDVIITAEAKGITLVHEMVRQQGRSMYVVARKNHKLYMQNAISVNVYSITTNFQQTLYIDQGDSELLKDKRVLIVDDVISTGESLAAVEKLVKKAGGNIVAKMAVLAEGDAKHRGDILFINELPLFDRDGKPIA